MGMALVQEDRRAKMWLVVGLSFGGFVVCFITALLLHGIWIAPFLDRHGRRTDVRFKHLFFSFGLYGALMRDYSVARNICRRQKRNPVWLKTFLTFVYSAAACLLVAISFLVLAVIDSN